MAIIKIYDLETTAGKKSKFYDDLSYRLTAALASAKSTNESSVRQLFRDDSSSGGLTIQEKLDSIGTEGVSLLSKVHAVQVMLTTLDPDYTPVTAASLGYGVTQNMDGSLTLN